MEKIIVITGSTRGIGLGLAEAFLARGCGVMISGRSLEGLESALSTIRGVKRSDQASGVPCDVTQLDELERLWEVAVKQFGRVDVWINNAGLGHDMLPLWELPPARVHQVISTNVLGVALGSHVAMQHMITQGGGQLYNMQGYGADGNVRQGLSVYAASKAAVMSLTQSLFKEADSTPVQVGSLSPGMVMTDLLLAPMENDPENPERTKRIFNILADQVETVTPWLADQVLANDRNGAEIEWLTRGKIMRRFAMSPFTKRDLFAEMDR